MKRIWSMTVACALCLSAAFVAGCDEPPPPAAAASVTKPPPPAPKPTAAATASAAATRDAAKRMMANCPNAVTGAETVIADTPEGVALTVTAKDEAAVKEIRARAGHAAIAAKADPTPGAHTGEGKGGGTLGRCPVVMHDTLVEVSDVEGGSKIVVKAKNPAEVDWLRREAKDRNAELAAPGALDAGQRKMANCPSAAPGAKTAIAEVNGAVEVTVTAEGDAAVADVRDRAKKVVEASKLDPNDVKHTGDGQGGGGLGRCPVVLKDTTVEARDVPGGTTIAMKPKTAAGLAALTIEVKARADKLAMQPAAPK